MTCRNARLIKIFLCLILQVVNNRALYQTKERVSKSKIEHRVKRHGVSEIARQLQFKLTPSPLQVTLTCLVLIIIFNTNFIIISPILIRVYPRKRGGRIYPTLSAIFLTPTLHLARFMTSFFSKPNLFLIITFPALGIPKVERGTPQ